MELYQLGESTGLARLLEVGIPARATPSELYFGELLDAKPADVSSTSRQLSAMAQPSER
ncbi:MAG: hypothetical protein AB4050_12965 [Synechococcus sp.]